MSLKQVIGAYIIPKLPINRHVFNHFRLELNALRVSVLNKMSPMRRAKIHNLKQQRNLLVNIGCGPFGKSDWINLDLFPAQNVTLIADCRRRLPLATASCRGIHVEHYL